MDNLASLGSDLPRHASTKQQLASLDANLVAEFKTAACAVTKLYKLSGAKTAIARRQGYVDALKDVMAFLRERENVSGDEVYAWALEKCQGLDDEDEEDVASPPPPQAPASSASPGPTTGNTTKQNTDIEVSSPAARPIVAKTPMSRERPFTFTAGQQLVNSTLPTPAGFDGDIFSFNPEAFASTNTVVGNTNTSMMESNSESDVSDDEVLPGSTNTTGSKRRLAPLRSSLAEKRSRF